MKKVFFIAAFVLVSAGVFALPLWTGNIGDYLVQLAYEGKNEGQQTANRRIREAREARSNFTVQTDIKLTNVHWDMIRTVLSRYEHSRGDTYLIILAVGIDDQFYCYEVVVEYTSATQYTYWSWMYFRSF